VIDPLSLAAAHARWVLAAGLAIAVALPPLAEFMAQFLVPLIMLVMFLGALRLAPSDMRAVFAKPGRALFWVLVIQLVFPLLAAAGGALLGVADTVWAQSFVLIFAAPVLVSSPNIAAMLKLDGVKAMQLLIFGTALTPLTALPALYLLFGQADLLGVAFAALRLAAIIAVAGGFGILARLILFPNANATMVARFDGASVLALAAFVIALLAGLQDTYRESLALLIAWFLFAFGVNFGLQIATWRVLGQQDHGARGTIAMATANRNIALLFASVPAEQTAIFLPLLAAYQFPMFLTPLLMGWLYRRADAGQGPEPDP